MNLIFTIYSVFFLATALVSFFVAFLAWQRRFVKGSKELTLLMIAAGIGAFWLIFETAAPTMSEKIFWSKLEFIGGIPTPVLYLIFVLRFTGKDKFISPKYIFLLFIIPVITFALTITNEHHNLIWSGFSAISEKTNLMEYFHGMGFWIGYIAYTYLMLLLAVVCLFSFIIRQNKPFSFQGWIVLISGLCPWITSVVYLTGSNPVTGLDISPISIIISGTLAAYAILNIRFLDLVPVAREMLVETLPDGILALDKQNRIQDINGAAIAFLGIPNKYIIGFPASDVGASATWLMNAAISNDAGDQIDIQNNNENKTFRIIKHTIKNQPGSRLIVIQDITEQVASNKEIRAGEERYRQMFSMFRLMSDNIDDFLWAKDMDNKYTFVNKTMCDRLLVAKSVHEPIGKTDAFFINREKETHPDNHEWHTFSIDPITTDILTISEKDSRKYDTFGNVQGKFLFLDVHKAPIWDHLGNQIGIVGTARDVTLTKQLEKEKTVALELLQKSENNLQKINAEKDKFFSIIAHDLRSPFSGFLGLTEIMAEDLPSLTMEEIRDISVSMKKSAVNLFRLLENLLNWAKMQQRLIPLKKDLVVLHLVVEESVAMLLESAKTKEIEIIWHIPHEIEIFADTNMLQTIIRNLVSNAVKFTLPGGKVNISARTTKDKNVEISVEDTGIGMSPAMVDHLFRLDIKTSRKGTEGEPSSGLGLLLCKEFVEIQGGKIWVESDEGKGSTFHFTIPYNEKQEETVYLNSRTEIGKI
ncbi:MAG TPA: histidine kinase N-terminal 7TM domain-containing protein [Prolixibacteraceae bacterium]|jgi:signal transduction histidine kinase